MDLLSDQFLSDVVAGVGVGVSSYVVWACSGVLTSQASHASDHFVEAVRRLVFVWASLIVSAQMLDLVGLFVPWALHGAVTVSWLFIGFVATLRSRRLRSEVKQATAESVPALNEASNGSRGISWAQSIVVGLLVAQVALFGVLQFPNDWDTLAYHLPIIDHWIQDSSLRTQAGAFWYVPGNSELIGYWFAAPFSGDYWVQLANLPVALLLLCAVQSLTKELSFSGGWRWGITAVVVCSTPVLRQATTVENDLAVIALFFGGLLFIVCRLTRHVQADLIGAVVCVGLLAGVKFYAVAYAGLLAGCLVAVEWRRASMKHVATVVGSVTVSLTVFASFWYLRNWLLAGSPIYPKGIALLGMSGPWDTLRPDFGGTSLARGISVDAVPLLLKAWIAQAGPLVALSSLVAIPLVMGVSISRAMQRHAKYSEVADRTHSEGVNSATRNGPVLQTKLLTGALIGCFSTYLITPNVIETTAGSFNMVRLQYHSVRFGLPFAFLAVIVTSSAIHQARGGWVRVLRDQWFVLAVVSIVWALLPQYGLRSAYLEHGIRLWRSAPLDYPWWQWGISTLVAVCFIYFWFRTPRLASAGGPCLIAAFAFATPLLSGRWHAGFETHYQAQVTDWFGISRLAMLPGDGVMVCDYRYYGAFGSARQFRASRPGWLLSFDDFQKFVTAQSPRWLAVPHNDRHWSGSYDDTKQWAGALGASYRHSGRTGAFVLYEQVDDVQPLSPANLRRAVR